MLKMFSKKRGFTLVELMVVVIIIGILVAIAIPLYSGIQQKAKESACEANVRTISGAAAMYHAENGSFPADVVALVTDGYLQDTPVCPLGGEYSIDNDDGVASCDHDE